MKKFAGLLLSLLLAAGVLSGCGSAEAPAQQQKQEKTAEAFPAEVKDASGKEIKIEKEPQKIVSLMPSNTEITYALGLGKKVVGVTDFDTYPKEVKDVEKIGGMEFNTEKIISLNPDLVLAHASSMQSAEEGLKQLRDAGISVVMVNDATSFEETYQSINMIGEATGAKHEAGDLVKSMKSDLAAIKEKAESISESEQKKVFVEVSPAPDIYTTGKGTFMNEMLEAIHAKNAASEQEGWAKMTEESIIKLNPDVIVTTNGASSVGEIKKRSGWSNVKAIQNNEVYDVDPDLVTRPGPRLIKGVEELAENIYPDVFKK
ncbi:ABC transporter substrate-binding protein [Bacillus swezeyi]|uniref:ABC transporter substrate-binding protein n=1 Tax=Bacillus swezeyi TaxID=1925020 RepID=A0A5M8RUU5_9BACI|nr:ABC transporter substrate-binding protein [Bacillus swezeyi]KAA6450614.1 ABC transporter substrate-binding protein [Bacillus swezeyi]KAA6475209.1 ABC transporter substrate-binding protein [Bacillus swezeyi]TYS37150.1 ABC transporter substrate-binding protein [Bacillus swezeyi]